MLYFRDGHIMSTTEGKQDDSLERLLFAFVLHSLIYHIKENCKFLLRV